LMPGLECSCYVPTYAAVPVHPWVGIAALGRLVD
jgi:hypothetical protein